MNSYKLWNMNKSFLFKIEKIIYLWEIQLIILKKKNVIFRLENYFSKNKMVAIFVRYV